MFGPIIGAIVVNFGKSWFTSVLPEIWLFALGGLFLAVTLFLPQGLAGLFKTRSRKAGSPASAGRPTRSRGVDIMELAAGSILYLDGVSVSFDGFKALNDLSFIVAPGEMRAIIGPNGAGKTTMMDVVTGKTRPDTGDVLFKGDSDLTRLDEAQIAQLGIGRKFQKPSVYEKLTVRENLSLALSGDRSVRASLLWRITPAQKDARRPYSRDHPACAAPRYARRATCRTDKSSGSRSACCSPRIRNCCWSTNRSPA